MGLYYYSARNAAGNIIKGSFHAADQIAVTNMLRNQGSVPLEITQRMDLNESFEKILPKRITAKSLAIFCKQFGTVLEAGIPVLESLDIIRKQTESRTLKDVLNQTFENVQKGKSLSEGLKENKDLVPPILINMLEAGEASGTLDKVFLRLSTIFETEYKLINKVKGAMIYPIIILIVAVLALLIVLWKVVPQFVTMFDQLGATLPLPTRVLIGLSNFVSSHILLVGGVLAALAAGVVYFLRTEEGKKFLDKFYLNMWPFSNMYRKLVSARFTRTMSSLLSAGLPLIQCLQITERVINNSVFSTYMNKTISDVTKGQKLSESLGTIEIMPSMVISMTSIGEESGSLDSLMDKVADFYEEETQTAVDKLTALLEPAIIILVAVLVGGMVTAIAFPMFEMMGQMKNVQ